jgi:hypothetical protein
VRLAAEQAVERQIVERVGRETIRVVLASHDLKPWREKNVVRSRVTERIRARARAGLAGHAAAVERDTRALYTSARRTFPTWDDALAAAGLENESPPHEQWDRERVHVRLAGRRQEGLSLAPARVRADDPPLYQAARRHFGSYPEAARHLGWTPSSPKWTKARIVAALRRRGRRQHVPCGFEPALRAACLRTFGSVAAARVAAGVADPAREQYEVCAGRLPLAMAQEEIAGDWVTHWVAAGS